MYEFETTAVATLEGREVVAHVQRDPRGMVEHIRIAFDDNGSHGLPSLFAKHDRHDPLIAPTFEINWSAWGSQSIETTRSYAQLLLDLADYAQRVNDENAALLAENEHEWRARLVQWEAVEDIAREEIQYQQLRAATGIELAEGDRLILVRDAYRHLDRIRYAIHPDGRAKRTYDRSDEREFLTTARGNGYTHDERNGKTTRTRKPRATA